MFRNLGNLMSNIFFLLGSIIVSIGAWLAPMCVYVGQVLWATLEILLVIYMLGQIDFV